MVRLDQEGADDRGVAPSRFRAGHAILSFAAVMVAQFVIALPVMLIAMVIAIVAGEDLQNAAVSKAIIERSTPALLIAAATVTLLLTWAIARAFAWDLMRDRTPNGLGLFSPGARQLVLWSLAGFALNVAYQVVARLLPSTWEGGPLSKMAASGGGARLVIAAMAVLVAPYAEELLFRGLMFRGLAASWGGTAAGIIVTVLFFVLHLFDTYGYWPAMLAILSLAVLTLFARLRSGSLYAAIAAHTAYNLAAIVGMYLALPTRTR